MAEAYGTRLLQEIQTETLSELLSRLSSALPISRNPTFPPIPILRDILRLYDLAAVPSALANEHPNQDALIGIPSSPSPPSSTSAPPYAGDGAGLKYSKPPIIEVTSASPKTSGLRTQFTNHLLCSLLQYQPGRPNGMVLLFDCAYKHSHCIENLHSQFLRFCGGDHARTQEALSRLHVFHPTSSRDILRQLRQIPKYLALQGDRNVVLAGIFLADLSAFYWSERWDEEIIRSRTILAGGDTDADEAQRLFSRESLHVMLLTEVSMLQKTWRCAVLVSALGVGAGVASGVDVVDSGGMVDAVKSGLPGLWERAVNVKVVLGQAADGKADILIEAYKWLVACGGTVSVEGKARGQITVHREGIDIDELRRDE